MDNIVKSHQLTRVRFKLDLVFSLSLQTHTLSLIRPDAKALFGIHDPTGHRYLILLHVKLSPIRYHYFVDISSEICECECAIEDTSHFRLHCRLYSEQSRTLASNVFAILRNHRLTHLLNETDVYLFGNKDLGNNRMHKKTERFPFPLFFYVFAVV